MSNSLKAIPIVVHFQQSQVSLGYRRGIEQKWDKIQFGVAFKIHVPSISQNFVAKIQKRTNLNSSRRAGSKTPYSRLGDEKAPQG